MELFDTHAHFGGTAAETAALLERARSAGVSRVMAVGGDEALNAGARAAARIAEGDPSRYPEVFAAVGWANDYAPIEAYLRANSTCYFKTVPELDAFLRQVNEY